MTVTALMSRPASMPGYKNGDLEEVQAITSYPSSMASHGSGLYFSQTEPTDLMHGSWGNATEGTQNFQEYTDNRPSHSGEAEESNVTSGQTTPRGSRLDRRQTMDNSWTVSGLTSTVPMGGQAMSRVDSCRSNGSLLSHTSHMSRSDVRGNATAFRIGSHANEAIVGVDFPLLGADSGALNNTMYWPGYNLDSGLDGDGSVFSISEVSPAHVVPSQMQFGPDNTALPDSSSPGSWTSFPSSISRGSSPVTIDEVWLHGHGPRTLSPNSSPEMACQSPILDFQEKMANEDMSATVIPSIGDNLILPPTFPARRDGDSTSARSHDLYKSATPGDDGLYHCPWEGDASCNHKPEKLKCNYDKFVDSHLKPYRCKADACEGARFSSTACLLRHEREAHGLHGHGDKPFLCQYEGCERGVPGNGFPRQWNLKDHMKRVHNDHGSSGGSPPSTTSQQPKGRKRKTDGAHPQTTTSRKASQKTASTKEARVSAKPLLDQWYEQRLSLEETVRGLGKPDDARTLQQLADIQKRVALLTKMSSNLNGVPSSADASQLPGSLSYVSTG